MKLEEIKNNPELMNQLRWDLTPQNTDFPQNQTITDSMSQEELDRLNMEMVDKAGAYFYIDVWNCTARLALMIRDAFGHGRSERIQKFDSPLIEESLYDCGGAVNISGMYPINSDLEEELKKKLNIQ